MPRLLLLIVLASAALVRLRLAGMPLDRDEGEYAYMGQLILRGEIPYIAAHNMKLPGVYYAYAAIMGALGETDVAIRIGAIAVNLLSIVLVYSLGRRLLDVPAALTAAAALATLSLSQTVDGVTATAEHFLLPPMLAGVLLLVSPEPRGWARTIAAGLLLGVALVVKQHGAAFLVFGGLWVLTARGTAGWRQALAESLAFSVAAVAPYGALCLGLWYAGAFESFWFWTVTYGRLYAVMVPFDAGLERLRGMTWQLLTTAPGLWLAAAGGLIAAWADTAARRAAWFLWLFALCSAAAVATGWRFAEHYFVLGLPAASLLIGTSVSVLGRLADRRRPGLGAAVQVALPLLAVGTSLLGERAYMFQLSPTAVARATYGINPFPEAVEIGRRLRERSQPDDRIAVIGSEPEIYFYAARRAALSYMHIYPLMEPHPFAHRMQEEVIAQLERARPRFLVLVNVDTSWTRRAESSVAIMDWASRTAEEEYRLIGLAEIFGDGSSRHRWDADVAEARPQSQAYVLTFERAVRQ